MRWLAISLVALLFGCASDMRMGDGAQERPLKNTEGYLSFVFDSLDPLKAIKILNTQTNDDFYVGRSEPGVNQITLRLEEGEYCFIGFQVYDFRVEFVQEGFCTYVEAGEVNYFGDIIVRDPVSVTKINYPRFLRLLKRDHPEICRKFINEECQA